MAGHFPPKRVAVTKVDRSGKRLKGLHEQKTQASMDGAEGNDSRPLPEAESAETDAGSETESQDELHLFLKAVYLHLEKENL